MNASDSWRLSLEVCAELLQVLPAKVARQSADTKRFLGVRLMAVWPDSDGQHFCLIYDRPTGDGSWVTLGLRRPVYNPMDAWLTDAQSIAEDAAEDAIEPTDWQGITPDRHGIRWWGNLPGFVGVLMPPAPG